MASTFMRTSTSGASMAEMARVREWVANHADDDFGEIMHQLVSAMASAIVDAAAYNVENNMGNIAEAPHQLKQTRQYINSFMAEESADSAPDHPVYDVGVEDIVHAGHKGSSDIDMGELMEILEYGGPVQRAFPHWRPARAEVEADFERVVYEVLNDWMDSIAMTPGGAKRSVKAAMRRPLSTKVRKR